MKGIFDDLYEEMRDEGRTEGRKEEQLKMAGLVRNVMTDNHWTLDKTLEFLHLSQEDGKSLMALIFTILHHNGRHLYADHHFSAKL